MMEERKREIETKSLLLIPLQRTLKINPMQNFPESFHIWPKVPQKFSAKFPYVLRKFLDESLPVQNFRSLVKIPWF